MIIHGDLFEGLSSGRVPAALEIDRLGNVRLYGAEFERTLHVSLVEVSPRIHSRFRAVYFPDGATFETTETDELDAALGLPPSAAVAPGRPG